MEVDTFEAPPSYEQTPAKPIVEKPDREVAPAAKSGPPTLSEWQDFFGRIVVKLLVDVYLNIVLGDIITELSPAEASAITLSKEELREIAAPMATLANNSKLMRRHGRQIVASADMYESVLTLLFWTRRVNRIASKHRPEKPRQSRASRRQQRRTETESKNRAQVSDGYPAGEVNGAQQPGFTVFNPGSG